eukprot:EG_transcript_22348
MPMLPGVERKPGEIFTNDVASYPLPGCGTPTQYRFSTDGRHITYLRTTETSFNKQLFAFNPSTGQETLIVRPPERTTESLTETLRRERQRILDVGVVQYAWAQNCNRLLVPLNGGIFVQDGVEPPLRCLVAAEAGASIVDPQISPCGNWVAYVQLNEVHVVSARPGPPPQPRQITFGAREPGRAYGVAEFVAQEEMDREHGVWWSPCGQFLAVTEVDEAHIPCYHITHQGKDGGGDEMMEDLRYPFAGCPNAIVRVGVISVHGGDIIWMNLTADTEYVA